MNKTILFLLLSFSLSINLPLFSKNISSNKIRVIVTTDGEIDDECSLVRFLLYSNEWDIEGIITTSSQYHWHGHKWAGDNWMNNVLAGYEKVYPNLLLHSKQYPSPEYLRKRIFLGNVETEGEMELKTDGANHIVNVLLDKSDDRPIWIQSWGGNNTLARALKTIEEDYPNRMEDVAQKLRFFFIWEQDNTYQSYILPHWGKYNIMTIISDQFEAIAYRWRMAQPENMHAYYEGKWMKKNILENHGELCSSYKAHDNGDFRSEGDSPAFIHTINTGLNNIENPDWGGWGGRYVKVRQNTWLDIVPDTSYIYPIGRWWGENGWGRCSLRPESQVTEKMRLEYFKPIWRWSPALQNDFAARADWCVRSFKDANHPPIVSVAGRLERNISKGNKCILNAQKSIDPDCDSLSFKWWIYKECSTYKKDIEIINDNTESCFFIVPDDAKLGDKIHIICEVADNGTPSLTRYKRILVTVK